MHRHQCGHTADTSATAEIAAPLQVTHLLSEESREHASVAALTHQLVELQAEVQTAHERLHQTQARVEHNLERVSALKAEAASLEKLRQQSAAEGSSRQGMACRPPAPASDHSAAALESQQVGCSCLPRGQHVLPWEPGCRMQLFTQGSSPDNCLVHVRRSSKGTASALSVQNRAPLKRRKVTRCLSSLCFGMPA